MPTASKLDSSNTRQELRRASHAPGEIYTSREVFRREVEVYFKRDWLYVGRVEELAEPGDYVALRLIDEPVLVARDKNGALHACYNMCAHRGVEVAYGSGNTRSFKCPYHGWVYGLDGRLTGAAYMDDSDEFDLKNCRLPPLRLEVWRGNMFINFDPQARPLGEALAEFEKDFAFLGWEKCRLANRIELELACNWKFVHENLMDFYHVGVLHAKSFGAKFSWDDDQVRAKPDGGPHDLLQRRSADAGRRAAARQDAVARGQALQLCVYRLHAAEPHHLRPHRLHPANGVLADRRSAHARRDLSPVSGELLRAAGL